MLLSCRTNQAADLPEAFISEYYHVGRQVAFPLTVGRPYVVYALTTSIGGLWAYVASDHYADDSSYNYPVWHPLPLFEIVDGRLSPTWVAGQRGDGDAYEIVLSFPEWAANPRFYEALVDGDEAAVATFRRYKTILDSEHRLA